MLGNWAGERLFSKSHWPTLTTTLHLSMIFKLSKTFLKISNLSLLSKSFKFIQNPTNIFKYFLPFVHLEPPSLISSHNLEKFITLVLLDMMYQPVEYWIAICWPKCTRDQKLPRTSSRHESFSAGAVGQKLW